MIPKQLLLDPYEPVAKPDDGIYFLNMTYERDKDE